MQAAILPAKTALNLTRWSFGRAIWGLLAIYWVGYALTSDFFPPEDRAVYFILSTVATAACGVFINALRGSVRYSLPSLLIFAIFVWGYYIEFYWLIRYEDKPRLGYILAASLQPEPMLRAFGQTTLAFALCAIALNVVRFVRSERGSNDRPISDDARLSTCRVAILVAGVILLVTTILMVVFGIGAPGRFVTLPFRLSGWVMRSRRVALPAMLLLVLSLSSTTKLRGYYHAAIGVFVLTGLSDMLLTTTRASFVLIALHVFTLFAVQNRVSRQSWGFVGAAVVATGLMFPFLSRLRDNRVGGMQTVAALEAAGGDAPASDDDEGTVSLILSPLLKRFTGMNALVPIVADDARAEPAEVIRGFYDSEHGVSLINTREVYGYRPGDLTAVAPSLLGWFYIAGGETWQGVGCLAAVLLAHLLWLSSLRLRLRVGPVLQSLLSVYIITHFSEGTLEDVFQAMVVIAGTITSLELLVSFVERGSKVAGAASHQSIAPASGS